MADETSYRRMVPVAVLCVALAALSACSNNDAAASPPSQLPIPTSAPPYTPGAQEAEEAIAAYAAYIAMIDETGRAGGYDIVDDGEKARPESVLKTTMNEEREYVDGSNQRLHRDKEKQIGTRKVVRVEVVKSVPVPDDPGGHRVDLYTCIDQSSVKLQGPKGTRNPAAYFEEWPQLFYDLNSPKGWKVSNKPNEIASSC